MDEEKLEYLNSLHNEIEMLKKSEVEKAPFANSKTTKIFENDTQN